METNQKKHFLKIIIIFLYSSFYYLNAENSDFKKIENKKFVVVIPSYNNKDWYKNNLDSVLGQTYKNYRAIYIDDCSPDGTYKFVKQYLTKFDKEKKFTLIGNETRQLALANHYKAIHMCDDNEIIVNLDGDDFFANDKILELLNIVYSDSNVWLTYSQFENWPLKKIGWCKPYPNINIKTNCFREFGFWCAQLRTFYVWLAKRIKLEDLLYDETPFEGKFYPMSGDVALMFPMLEMCGDRFKFIPDILVERNVANQINDYKVSQNMQTHIARKICKKEKYKRLIEKPREIKNNYKTDLIIFSFDRPIQLYALLESIEKYIKGLENISVIYRTSNEEFEKAYQKLIENFKNINFIAQGTTPNKDLKLLISGAIISSVNNYIMFAVDDDIVKDYINIETCARAMKKTHAYGFYLRLGKNINYSYMPNIESPTPINIEIEKDIYAYQFKYAKEKYSEWQWAPSFDMTIFNKKELLKELKKIKFNFDSINSLEWKLYENFNKDKNNLNKVGLFFETSKIINLPLNLVQKNYPKNRNLKLYSKEFLLNKFNENLKIDITDFSKMNNNSSYVQYKPNFIKREDLFENNKFILITFLYNEKNLDRINEYKKCIEKNLSHKSINKLHVIYDVSNDDKKNILLNFLKSKKIKISYLKDRPTIGYIIKLVNKKYPNSKIILSNADIYFNKTLELLNDYDLSKKFITLTRYDLQKDGSLKIRNDGGNFFNGITQDAWIFKTPIPNFYDQSIKVGLVGCEMLINYQAKKAGLDVINPCLSIQCCHLHQCNIRHYNTNFTKEFFIDLFNKNKGKFLSVPWQKL